MVTTSSQITSKSSTQPQTLAAKMNDDVFQLSFRWPFLLQREIITARHFRGTQHNQETNPCPSMFFLDIQRSATPASAKSQFALVQSGKFWHLTSWVSRGKPVNFRRPQIASVIFDIVPVILLRRNLVPRWNDMVQ